MLQILKLTDYNPEYSDSDINTTDFFSTKITTNAINSNTIKMNTDNKTDYIPNTTYNTYTIDLFIFINNIYKH